MKNKKAPNLFFVLIAIILGQALYEQFDFENLSFEKPALAIVYGITFIFTAYFLIKDFKNKPKE